MPPRKTLHRNCRLSPLAADLRRELLGRISRLRGAIEQAERIADERGADKLRLDLLSAGDLLARVDMVMRQHAADAYSESQGQAELAELRRATLELTA